MPRGNGTGPGGMGPMTGRGAGYCAGYPVPGYMNPFGGRGPGSGYGYWRGRGRGFHRFSPGNPYYGYPLYRGYGSNLFPTPYYGIPRTPMFRW